MPLWEALRLEVTPKMRQLLSLNLPADQLPKELQPEGDGDDKTYITASGLRELWKKVRATDGENPTFFHELVEDSELSISPLPVVERNPELVARLERIKAQLAHREYDKMVENVSSQTAQDSSVSVAADLRHMTRQMTVLLNTILTVVGAFIFGFMASKYLGLNFATQMSVGLFIGMVVFFADLYFIVRHEARLELNPTGSSLKKVQ